jgi:formate dehydrogenase alpha subunit
MEWITITIDGRNIQVPADISILEACRTNKIQIPTLCHDPELTDSGACRLCMVEVEGARGLVASCSTKVQKGMVIRTDTNEIREARRTILELIIANHDIDCLTCQKMGNCDLAQYAYEYGVKKDVFQGEKREYDVDDSNPFILRDLNKCILCGKCVRACSEIQVNNVLSYANRGFESRVGPAFNLPYDKSECVFCGTCLAVCPVGALTEKKMIAKGRPWEIKKVRTTCPFCGTGCSFDLNVREGKVIGVTTDASAPVNGRFLCVKGRFGIDLVHSPERLTTPLIRKNGELVEAEWYEAFELIASKFKEIKNKYGADSLGALSSARCTNEDNYVMQKFMRVVIGTNNIDHCARVCHAPSVAGLATSFGSGAMTNAIKEIPTSKVIFAIGTNATEAHPIIGTKIKQAVRNGCRLIVADPRKIELVDHAELWMRLKPGTDIALINGIMHMILANEWEDKEFIKERTVGFENLKELLRDYTPDYVSKITGVPEEQLYKAAEIYACAERAQIFYTLGITEHTHGTDNVMSLANLAMLTGNVGKENSGVNPLRDKIMFRRL